MNIQKRCTIWRYLLFWTPGISFCILIWIEVYMSPYFSRVNLNCDLELTVPCRCFSFWDGSGLPSFHMLGKFGLGLGRCVHFLTLLELFFPFLRVISCTARIDIPLIFFVSYRIWYPCCVLHGKLFFHPAGKHANSIHTNIPFFLNTVRRDLLVSSF
jgi:hypothetical protein